MPRTVRGRNVVLAANTPATKLSPPGSADLRPACCLHHRRVTPRFRTFSESRNAKPRRGNRIPADVTEPRTAAAGDRELTGAQRVTHDMADVLPTPARRLPRMLDRDASATTGRDHQVLRALTVLLRLAASSRGGMWAGYEEALVRYGLVVCDEWCRRGHADTSAPLLLADYGLGTGVTSSATRTRSPRQASYLDGSVSRRFTSATSPPSSARTPRTTALPSRRRRRLPIRLAPIDRERRVPVDAGAVNSLPAGIHHRRPDFRKDP